MLEYIRELNKGRKSALDNLGILILFYWDTLRKRCWWNVETKKGFLLSWYFFNRIIFFLLLPLFHFIWGRVSLYVGVGTPRS